MQLQLKNTFWGYFLFYYNIIGYRLFVGILLSITVSLLDGLGLTMLMPLLQAVEGGTATSEETMGSLHYFASFLENFGLSLTVNSVLVVIACLFMLKGFVTFLDQNYQIGLIHLFMKKVRHKLVSNLNNLSYEGYLQLDAGTIQNTFISEVQRMSQAIKGYLRAAQGLLMMLTYVVLAVMANYQFAIMVTAAALLSNLFYRKIYLMVKSLSGQISKKGNFFNAYMIEAIHNFKYLKSTGYFTTFSKKLDSVIDKTEILNKKTGFYNAITTGIREPMVVVIVVFVIFVQVNYLGGTFSSIILSLLLFYRGLNYLINVQNYWQVFVQNIGALQSVTKISGKMKLMHEKDGTKIFDYVNNSIEFKDVDFFYGKTQILNNIDIVIPKNKTIAFVGGSGAGKTTLANILCGLILPQKGNVYVDQQPLLEFNLTSYRSKIGYISQESAIFNDTIYNNITLWAENTEANIKKFWAVIKLASLEDYLDSLPHKENTFMGDHGILISGGQKQRISMARELFKEPEILILDEATSALDSETEQVIQENLEKLKGNFTMIIIAHRLSTIKNADFIYLLESGNIINYGNYESLLDLSDKFKRMVDLQGLN